MHITYDVSSDTPTVVSSVEEDITEEEISRWFFLQDLVPSDAPAFRRIRVTTIDPLETITFENYRNFEDIYIVYYGANRQSILKRMHYFNVPDAGSFSFSLEGNFGTVLDIYISPVNPELPSSYGDITYTTFPHGEVLSIVEEDITIKEHQRWNFSPSRREDDRFKKYKITLTLPEKWFRLYPVINVKQAYVVYVNAEGQFDYEYKRSKNLNYIDFRLSDNAGTVLYVFIHSNSRGYHFSLGGIQFIQSFASSFNIYTRELPISQQDIDQWAFLRERKIPIIKKEKITTQIISQNIIFKNWNNINRIFVVYRGETNELIFRRASIPPVAGEQDSISLDLISNSDTTFYIFMRVIDSELLFSHGDISFNPNPRTTTQVDLGIVASSSILSTAEKQLTRDGRVIPSASAVSYREYTAQIPYLSRQQVDVIQDLELANNGKNVEVDFEEGEMTEGGFLASLTWGAFEYIADDFYKTKITIREVRT